MSKIAIFLNSTLFYLVPKGTILLPKCTEAVWSKNFLLSPHHKAFVSVHKLEFFTAFHGQKTLAKFSKFIGPCFYVPTACPSDFAWGQFLPNFAKKGEKS